MSKVKIMVTAQDIEYGEPREGDACPIALACLRAFPGKRVYVSDDGIEVYERADDQPILVDVNRTSAGRYQLPPEAQVFIDRFDGRQDCSMLPLPFEFEVERS